MTITPSITIGITSFNAEATITAALVSALNQNLPASQIIVVDDASTDCTLEIVTDYSNQDSRILVLQNPVNSGVAVSRNRIVEQASGWLPDTSQRSLAAEWVSGHWVGR